MKTITVNTGKPYDIVIGQGILPYCGTYISKVFPANSKAAIITDDTVSALYLSQVQSSLESAGFTAPVFVFPHGENSKSEKTLFQIYRFLAEEHISRTDFIVALGGGVVGDIAGFAAATYLRGIAFIQLPTTFLAALDSSVGGKTAINIDAGKNLVGAFHQPSLVLCDIATFRTLSPDIFADGCAEMIKYGLIYSEPLFHEIETTDIEKNMENIVAQCVTIKKEVVEQDEFDTGLRMILNYGHTLGHAIEKLTHHQMTHGHAIAIGMVLIAHLGERLGFHGPELTDRIIACMQKYHLPTSFHGSLAQLAEFTLNDKKRAGDSIRLIFVTKPGCSKILSLPIQELCRLLCEEELQ